MSDFSDAYSSGKQIGYYSGYADGTKDTLKAVVDLIKYSHMTIEEIVEKLSNEKSCMDEGKC